MHILSDIDKLNHLFATETLHPQVAVVELEHADNSFFGSMRYEMFALILLENEFGELYRNNTRLAYSIGSLITVKPGQSVEMKLKDDVKPRGWMLAFKADLLDKTGLGRDFYMFSFFNADYNKAIDLSNVEHGVIRNCFYNLHTELNTPSDHLSGQLIRLGIGTLLSYVKRYFEKQHISGVRTCETMTGKLDALLDKYLGSGQPAQQGQPNVTWCAEQFALSPSHFSSLIKKELKITAQDYIRNKLIEHAQVLLRQTNMTINEIAEELGFSYPNHFTRMFRNTTGVTPLKYRKGPGKKN